MKALFEKVTAIVIKYRYAACILLIGIVLMLLPPANNAEESPKEIADTEIAAISVEEQLSTMLSKIQGAGKVEVMLSCAIGAETRYHADTDTDAESVRNTTVIITDGERNESALISRVDPPEYMGAIIICQGADSAAVRLAIVDAVSKFTGLGADQIAVLKMK